MDNKLVGIIGIVLVIIGVIGAIPTAINEEIKGVIGFGILGAIGIIMAVYGLSD